MYHIPNDKRSKDSARKIYKSLRRLLLTKNLNEITVSDIHNECGVSRSTFYRLFDNTVDVIELMFDYFYKRYLFRLQKENNKSLLFFFEYWTKHTDLVYILAHQNEGIIKKVMQENYEESTENKFLIDIKASILSSLLCRWVLDNKKESPKEMVELTKNILNKKCIDFLIED